MARIQDRISIHINRGVLKDDENYLVGEWFKYRMREVHNDLLKEFHDYEEGDEQPIKLEMSPGRGPLTYKLTGWTNVVGMTEIFQSAILRITKAMDIMEPFVTGARIDFSHSAVRSPFVTVDHQLGYLINTAKELEIRRVGKTARLGNGREPEAFLGNEAFGYEYDTQIKDVWVIGEPTAVRKLAGQVRALFRAKANNKYNDQTLNLVRSGMNAKALLIVDTMPSAIHTAGQFVIAQSLVSTPVVLQHYDKVVYGLAMEHYHTAGPDKLGMNETWGKRTNPIGLLNGLIKRHGKRDRYLNDQIKETPEEVIMNSAKYMVQNTTPFFTEVFKIQPSHVVEAYMGMESAHGDKVEQYRDFWERAGLDFNKAQIIYLLTFTNRMDRPKHQSDQWVVDNYATYSYLLP